MRNGHFTVKRVEVVAGPFKYWTFRLSGWLCGKRIRKQFTSKEEAIGAKTRYEIQATNAATAGDNQIKSANTRLTADQLADAESAFRRLGSGRSLSEAVEWYLANWRPPTAPMSISAADEAFRASKVGHVSPLVLRDYKRVLKDLANAFPGRLVSAITRVDIQAHMDQKKLGPKAWNNNRGMLSAFFRFCSDDDRRWAQGNPVSKIAKFKISRGVPAIETAEKIARLFRFLEDYAGEKFTKAKPGFLVPYFALCTFAGLRPSCPGGEAWKLGGVKDLSRIIDLELGVIRIGPEIAKNRDLRQVTIQPALMAWLDCYPLKDYPIRAKDIQRLVSLVRQKFELSPDVLRHTFISMHVAKFQSLGLAALESGNSERIIKKHYLNMVSVSEAERFWAIVPQCGSSGSEACISGSSRD